MNTKPLILSIDQIKKIADIPKDSKIKSVGMTEGFDQAVIFIESKEFKAGDYKDSIELREQA